MLQASSPAGLSNCASQWPGEPESGWPQGVSGLSLAQLVKVAGQICQSLPSNLHQFPPVPRKGTQVLPLGHWLQRFFSLRNRCLKKKNRVTMGDMPKLETC